MFVEALAPGARNALEVLSRARLPSGFYLAGGSAVALHLGHRVSHDLDLFSEDPFDRDALLRSLRSLGPIAVVREAEETLVVEIAGSRTAFLRYPYPRLEPGADSGWIAVAGPLDLSLMKLEAIVHRGARRDFLDWRVRGESASTLGRPTEGLDQRSTARFSPASALRAHRSVHLRSTRPLPSHRAPRPINPHSPAGGAV